MKKNSLTPNKGLSLSQAQSISNLCNQRAVEIDAQLSNINNYSKMVTISDISHTYTIQEGKEMPFNIVDLLKEKAKLHACQAYLMENIKAKELLMEQAKNEQPDLSEIKEPKKPFAELMDAEDNFLRRVDKNFGWEQLTVEEINEYLEAEAYASHIGQFIHNNGILTRLRNELPHIPSIEWITIKDGEKTPVVIKVHHTPEQLMAIHEELAALHRKYEQRVNYFKAKAENLTTIENARISKINADLQNMVEAHNNRLNNEYGIAYGEYIEKVKRIKAEFEEKRQAKIKEIASMRISVDPRFQDTINTFLNKIEDNDE